MFCPYCRRSIPDNTTICPACHNVITDSALASYYHDGKRYTKKGRKHAASYSIEKLGPESMENPKKRKVALIVVLIVAAIIVAAIAVPLAQESFAANRTDHRVTFLLKTPGYNDDATAIPVQVDGTTADGEAYSDLVFLDGGGNGVVLEEGEYTLTFPGGSLLANGTVLTAPKDAKLEVTVPEGLARNQFVQVPTDESISYKAILPIDLTDETLDDVYGYAVQDPNDNGKADTLRANAVEARETAQEKAAENTAAIEKEASGDLDISLGDEAKFVGTLEIASAEEVAERLNDENISWNLYGRTLAVLWLDKSRKVTIDTSGSEDDGSGYYYYDYDDDYDYDYDYDDGEDADANKQTYEVTCLVFSTDVDGVYSTGDDGTLSAYDGKKVVATGRVYLAEDWTSSLISPISLSSPTFETL